MFDGKMKALTFSYDDGTLQDARLADMFRKYNIRATFNINSGNFSKEGELLREGVVVDHTKLSVEDAKRVYNGFEIASHTLTHPNLDKLSEVEIVAQINDDVKNLSEIFETEISGFVYPGGRDCQTQYVYDTVKKNFNFLYAREIESSLSFDLQEDMMQFKPTVHHCKFNDLFELGHKFIDMKTDKPQIFYVWGHTFEFDINNSWDHFEEFLKMISFRSDIFYGTNKEVFSLLKE